MNGKKYINRAISLILSAVIAIGIAPMNAFASMQKHVKIKSILTGADTKDPSYVVNIEWNNPIIGTNDDQIAGFKIEERKASEAGSKFTLIKDEKGSTLTNISETRPDLDPGSIYEYKILPYHMDKDKEAPYDPSTPEETALLMTDIRVDTKGYGNTLEVTFDNPTYDGKNLFTGYRIYYAKGGDNVTNFNDGILVSVKNTDLVPSKDQARGVNRLTYKIVSNDIIPGRIYAVKVEPVYKGENIRDKHSNNIAVGKTHKEITYSSKETEYRKNDAHVSIPLYITEDDGKYIKLNWDDLSGLNITSPIEQIEIFSGDSLSNITTPMGVVYGHNITNYRVIKPAKKTYYRIKVTFKSKDMKPMESIVAMYSPGDVNLTPSKPKIYPKIKTTNNISTIDLFWDTFTRLPYNDDEKEEIDKDGLYFDTNVVYDIYISDTRKNLNKLGMPKSLDKVSANKLETLNIENVKNKVFKKNIKEYYTVLKNGDFEKRKIQENKTYYIKIVATKPVMEGVGLSSAPAYTQIYLPARGDISVPKSLSKPPLRVKKDEKGVDMITTKDMTVQWNTIWYEIYDKQTDTWYSKASIRDGNIYFGKEIKDTDNIIDFYDMESPNVIKNAFYQAGYSGYENLTIREVDLSSKDIKYEMIVEPFDKINIDGGYEKYIEELLVAADDRWKSITPTIKNKRYAEYDIKDLEENTRYVILFRPYKMIDDNKKEAYPTYLLATTLPKDTPIEITPATPILYEAGKTDISVLVEWEAPTDLYLYELAINKTPLDNPNEAKIKISSDDIEKNGTDITKDSTVYRRYNIEPLLPETGYYIWLRSNIKASDKKSGWSNPIYIYTDKLKKPSPPNGFGLASQKNLDIYNDSNDTKYVPKDSSYIVLEWLRNEKDTKEDAKSEKSDKAQSLIDEKIKGTYMAKFNELIPNKYYYTRAKTKVTIAETGNGIKKQYSYIISLSTNADFKDAIEIEVPSIDKADKDTISIESDWTTVFKFRTKQNTGEGSDFDSNIIDSLYPLPTEDFEIFYDPKTETLTYKFRSNKIGADGTSDNLVDQRFITNLINNKVFNYNIDLTHYFNNKIKNRRVQIPYSIISTLNSRKIALSITAGGTRLTLNPNFLDTKEVKSLGKMNDDTIVTISMDKYSIDIPVLSYNQTYATSPQTISISVLNNGRYKNMTHTGSLMDIKQKINSRGLFLENNVSSYRNVDNGKWNSIQSSYNDETGIFSVKTDRLGSYTNIATKPHSTNINIGGKDNNILASINEKIMFKDLKNTDLSLPISVVQFNNIVAGVVNNKKEININNGLSSKDAVSLKRSNMLLKGSIVRRDFGINTLVKLYEIKTKARYEPTDNIKTTQYKDIENAKKIYQKNLLKASELGFIETGNKVLPNDTLSMNDMLYMINIILLDSGY